MARYKPVVGRSKALRLAQLAVNDIDGLKDELHRISKVPSRTKSKKTWQHESKLMIKWLNGHRDTPYVIFSKGNSKLPFYSFSTLPLVTCPGMGECASFCYSLKAWRCPQPFFRQLQNTVLIKEQSEKIVDSFLSLPYHTTVRLYVDGDFDSLETMDFWFSLMKQRPDLNVYGYSKSWELFLNYDKEFPTNYVLNLSSGSKYDEDTKSRVAELPIVRGEFVALEGISKKSSWAEQAKQLREKAKKDLGYNKVFVCPGKCSSCTGAGHACGIKHMTVPVVIATH